MKSIQQAMLEEIYLQAHNVAHKNNQIAHHNDSRTIGSFFITLQQLEAILKVFQE